MYAMSPAYIRVFFWNVLYKETSTSPHPVLLFRFVHLFFL